MLERAKEVNYAQSKVCDHNSTSQLFHRPPQGEDGSTILEAPGGYAFHVYGRDTEGNGDPVYSVTLSISNLARSLQYWNQLLGMKIYSQSETSATLGYGDQQVCCKLCTEMPHVDASFFQARLQLMQITEPIDRAEASGRIAFSCPKSQVSCSPPNP